MSACAVDSATVHVRRERQRPSLGCLPCALGGQARPEGWFRPVTGRLVVGASRRWLAPSWHTPSGLARHLRFGLRAFDPRRYASMASACRAGSPAGRRGRLVDRWRNQHQPVTRPGLAARSARSIGDRHRRRSARRRRASSFVVHSRDRRMIRCQGHTPRRPLATARQRSTSRVLCRPPPAGLGRRPAGWAHGRMAPLEKCWAGARAPTDCMPATRRVSRRPSTCRRTRGPACDGETARQVVGDACRRAAEAWMVGKVTMDTAPSRGLTERGRGAPAVVRSDRAARFGARRPPRAVLADPARGDAVRSPCRSMLHRKTDAAWGRGVKKVGDCRPVPRPKAA